MDLEIHDVEAAGWLAGHLPAPTRIQSFGRVGRDCRPRLHLVLGDSIARRAVITSRFKDDRVLNRGRSRDKWDDLLARLDAEVTSWQTAAAAQGLIPGVVVIWLTGNELYGEHSWYANWTDETLAALGQSARAVVARLRPHADDVLVLGPLPRLAGEAGGEIWGKTAAFHAERTLLHTEGVRLIPLGRALTKKVSRNKHGLNQACEVWFQEDGVHLTPAGYEKLADAGSLPVWLTLRAAR